MFLFVEGTNKKKQEKKNYCEKYCNIPKYLIKQFGLLVTIPTWSGIG